MRSCIKYIIFNLLFIIFNSFCFSQNASSEASRTIDSLKLALKNAVHDTTRCNILKAMIESEGDDKIWINYNRQIKTIAEKNIVNGGALKNIYLKYLASAFNNLAIMYYNQGKVKEAIENNQKSLKIQIEIGNKWGIAESLNNMGVFYYDQGNIPTALEYYHKSLKIQEEVGDKSGIEYSLNNIGIIYEKQGDLLKALEYYNKSVKIGEEIGDKQGVANSLSNIGLIYLNQQNYSGALDCFTKSLENYEYVGENIGIAFSLTHLGAVYFKQGDLSKALEYYRRSLKIQEKIGDKQGVEQTLSNIAVLMLQKGQLNEALSFAKRGMQVAEELGFPLNIKNLAANIKTIYKKQNKYKEAFDMYELEIKMSDSINNQETQKAAVKKQMQYTYEKKELETKAEQDKKDVIAKAEIKQKENERNYFIAGFGLVLVLALFILRGYKQKQKANAIILEQKHLVDEKQKEILDSIHYAKRIQTALLPSEKYIDKSLKQLRKS